MVKEDKKREKRNSEQKEGQQMKEPIYAKQNADFTSRRMWNWRKPLAADSLARYFAARGYLQAVASDNSCRSTSAPYLPIDDRREVLWASSGAVARNWYPRKMGGI